MSGVALQEHFADLVGSSVWLYPQTDVFVDLAAARSRDGGDVRFGVSDTAVDGLTSERPVLRFTDTDGVAHTVPPTGAKGLNLALADVRVLAPVIRDFVTGRSERALDAYSEQALARVWQAQHFSYWMTSMLHLPIDGTGFDRRRQRAEIRSVVESRAASTHLAEGYAGWPA